MRMTNQLRMFNESFNHTSNEDIRDKSLLDAVDISVNTPGETVNNPIGNRTQYDLQDYQNLVDVPN